MFQALEMDRTGNTFGAKHPVIQTIDQLEVLAAISAKAFRLVTPEDDRGYALTQSFRRYRFAA